MTGLLSSQEVEGLLMKQVVGRIGCHNKQEVYVVPISYAYDGQYIYCHCHEGKKLEMMRGNPAVCFQVDEMKDMANWKSVVVNGIFEELTNNTNKTKALKLLLERELPISSSVTTHLGDTWPFTATGSNELVDVPGTVFRISVKEKTGRFENTSGTQFHMLN